MPENQPCPSCGGSGQISYFAGVSRFLLSFEECPGCAGLGYLLEPQPAKKPAGGQAPKPRAKGSRKKADGK
jgi:DnaJ-class molecular chaperone